MFLRSAINYAIPQLIKAFVFADCKLDILCQTEHCRNVKKTNKNREKIFNSAIGCRRKTNAFGTFISRVADPSLSSTLARSDNLYRGPAQASAGLSRSYLHTPEHVLLLSVLLELCP